MAVLVLAVAAVAAGAWMLRRGPAPAGSAPAAMPEMEKARPASKVEAAEPAAPAAAPAAAERAPSRAQNALEGAPPNADAPRRVPVDETCRRYCAKRSECGVKVDGDCARDCATLLKAGADARSYECVAGAACARIADCGI